MRILIYGTGAVGGYFGARLAEAGNEVIFLARGANLEALRENGLNLESPKGNYRVWPIRVTDSTADLTALGLIIVGVKAWQVPEVARSLPQVMDAKTRVLTLQNGVDAPYEVAREVGAERVLGGVAKIIVSAGAPGHIRHLGMEPSITLGQLGRPGTSGAPALIVEALWSAGITVQVADNVESALWQKLLFIAAMSGAGAVTRSTIGEIRALAETRQMLTGVMEEISNVARAKGVPMEEGIVAKTMAFIDSLPAGGTASMQRDLVAGRPSELEAIVGAVVRAAEASKVEAPVSRFIYSALLLEERRARIAHGLGK